MTDNLRDRIAAALQGASDDGFSAEDWLFLADAVIRELGDVLKTSNSHVCGIHCPYGPRDERCHHWTATDQYCTRCGRPHSAGECKR